MSKHARHALQLDRNNPLLVALVVGLMTLLGGLVVLGTTGSARAATESFQLYSQVNPFVQPVPDDQGVQELSLTVTPSSAEPGAAIEVQVTSSTFDIASGPWTWRTVRTCR